MTIPSHDLGKKGELLATGFLRQEGYKILQANYRVKRGEIDIVAEDDGVICFVEVRSRKSTEFGHPFQTVDRTKRARLIRAAKHLVASRGWNDRSLRFDVVGIVFEPKLTIELIKGAFDLSGA